MPQVMLSFEPDEELEDVEKQALKASGIKFPENRIPNLRKTVPGLLPRLPANEDFTELLVVFEQVLDVLKRAKNDIDLILPEDDESVFIRHKKGGKWVDEFQPLIFESSAIKTPINLEELNEIKTNIKSTLPMIDGAVESFMQYQDENELD